MPLEKTFDVTETLDKVMRVFWAGGYEATSIQDLVDCTGVNRGSLYATYGDKHALFLAALHQYDRWLRNEVLSEAERRTSPREAIRQTFLAFMTSARDGGNNGCFLTNSALELAPHDPEVRRIVAGTQKHVERTFSRLIRRGKVLGEIPAHVKPGEAARGLLAALIGLAVLSRSRPEPSLLQSVVADALRRLE